MKNKKLSSNPIESFKRKVLNFLPEDIRKHLLQKSEHVKENGQNKESVLSLLASAPRKASSEEEMQKLAKKLDIPSYTTLREFQIDKEVTRLVPYSFVKKHLFLPVAIKENTLVVASYDLLNLDALEEIRILTNMQVETIYVPKQVIIAAIHEFYQQEEKISHALESERKAKDDDFENANEVFDLLDDSQDLPQALRLINFSIAEAIGQGASDIHFEPIENGLLIRYRIDGVLQNRLSPAHELQSQLLTRLKVMAKLDIAERRLPQDGRIKMRLGGKEIDFRVSTLPVVTGERIVLRILDKGNIVLGLDKIGMPHHVLEDFRKAIQWPEGIILVTGPTGSGKTTTLYSALTELKKDDTNIMTIEDPVEYRLKGVAQMGVHPKIGLSFAAGLRHILRQDPDIIMVGEIRDKETAEIAIQSALTGHLVLSTLHTNDAPSTIARLVDMGIEPYLISSCVVAVLAQRLVRKICPHCKETYKPTQSELISLNMAHSKEKDDLILYRGKGCHECLQSGYKGRHGIYELMSMSNPIRKQILSSPETNEIQKIALKQGMKTLRDHGIQLILDGMTTIEEVWRVTKGEDEG